MGRGGWSWYTGAAAWLHRAAIESIAGLRVKGDRVCLRPHLPSHWPHITITLRRGLDRHEFTVCAAHDVLAIDTALALGAGRLALGDWHLLTPGVGLQRHLIIVPLQARKANQVAASAL